MSSYCGVCKLMICLPGFALLSYTLAPSTYTKIEAQRETATWQEQDLGAVTTNVSHGH